MKQWIRFQSLKLYKIKYFKSFWISFVVTFLCFFWFLIRLLCYYFGGQSIDRSEFFFITQSNWFIPSYIALLFMAPILNIFCSSVNKNVLKKVVIILIFMEVWFDLLPPTPQVSLGSQKGYSAFSFAILYLLARYIKLYGLPSWFRNYSLWIYVFLSFFTATISYISFSFGYKIVPYILYKYSCPTTIISAVAFFTKFEKLNLADSKAINYVAKSTLAGLLGHSAIFFYYKRHFINIYTHFNGIECIGLWIFSIIIVYILCVVLDQFRILLYKPIDLFLRRHIHNNQIIQI